MKDRKLQEIFLERVQTKMANYDNSQEDYRMRKMAIGLHEKFDETWIDYISGNATYEQWDKALNNWLDAELLA